MGSSVPSPRLPFRATINSLKLRHPQRCDESVSWTWTPADLGFPSDRIVSHDFVSPALPVLVLSKSSVGLIFSSAYKDNHAASLQSRFLRHDEVSGSDGPFARSCSNY